MKANFDKTVVILTIWQCARSRNNITAASHKTTLKAILKLLSVWLHKEALMQANRDWGSYLT